MDVPKFPQEKFSPVMSAMDVRIIEAPEMQFIRQGNYQVVNIFNLMTNLTQKGTTKRPSDLVT